MALTLSSIKEIVPTAATTFVLTGILKALAFYYFFGIRIIDYIDFSESLLLFLDDLLIFFMVLLLTGLSLYLYKQSLFSLLAFNIVIIAGNSIYLYILLRNYYHISLYFSIVQSIALLFLSGGAFLYLYQKVSAGATGEAGKSLQNQVIILSLLFSFISTFIFRIKRDFDTTLYDAPDREVTCVFNDSSVVRTNKDTLYIGRTKKNFFFYEKSGKKALIFKEEEIKKVEIKTLRYPQIKYSF